MNYNSILRCVSPVPLYLDEFAEWARKGGEGGVEDEKGTGVEERWEERESGRSAAVVRKHTMVTMVEK